MTPAALRAALAALGWGPTHLARVLGCSRRLADGWLAESVPVPDAVAAWLEASVAAQLAPPVLAEVRRRRGRKKRTWEKISVDSGARL